MFIYLSPTGPPFTHLSQPERSVFFGDVSPKDRPEFYVKCIHNVYQTYADKYRNKIPLIVNTQGWVKGGLLHLAQSSIRTVTVHTPERWSGYSLEFCILA